MRFRPVLLPSISQLLQATVISILSGVISTLPARAADEIYFDFGPFSRSLSTASLEAFAEDGTIDAELAPYLKLVPPTNSRPATPIGHTTLFPESRYP
jgi:hypothetical protein